MQSKVVPQSPDFWKHKAWCKGHAFAQCVYNHDRHDQSYFRAPCCGRYVRFLNGKNVCKKCVGLNSRQAGRDKKIGEYVPQGLLDTTITHKVDDAQLSTLVQTIQGVGSVGEMVKGFESLEQSIVSQLQTAFTVVADSALEWIAKTTLALAIVWRSRDDLVTVVLAIVQYLLTLNIARSVVDTTRDYLMSFLNTFTAQSAGVEELFNVVAFVLNVIVLGVSPSISALHVFFRNIACLKNFTDVSTNVMHCISSVVTSAIEFVRVNFLGYHASWAEPSTYDSIINWCDRVDKLFASSTKQQWTIEMLDELDYLHDEYLAIQQLWRTSKPPSAASANVLHHYGVVRRMLEEVSCQGVRQIPRVAPTFLMIQGPTAYGKSFLTPYLCTDLLRLAEIKVRKSWASQIYYRNAETKFWDGYAGQKIIVYDDFAQVHDLAGIPNPELMEIIRLGNSAPFFPDMARLEAKGRTRIDCEFVVMTANAVPSQASVQSMKEPKAVLRRIDYLIEIKVKEEFLKGQRVDLDKVLERHHAGTCGCCVDHQIDMCVGHYLFNIKIWNGNSWELKDSGLSYSAMIKSIVMKHKVVRDSAKAQIDYLNNRLNADNFVDCEDSVVPQGGCDVGDFDLQREVFEIYYEVMDRVYLYSQGEITAQHLRDYLELSALHVVEIDPDRTDACTRVVVEMFHDFQDIVPQGLEDQERSALLDAQLSAIFIVCRRIVNSYHQGNITYSQLLMQCCKAQDRVLKIDPKCESATGRYLVYYLQGFIDSYHAQGLEDETEVKVLDSDALREKSLDDLIFGMRDGDDEALRVYDEFGLKFKQPFQQQSWVFNRDLILSGEASASDVREMCREFSVAPPHYVRPIIESSNKPFFDSVRATALEAVKSMTTKPFFYVLSAIGLAAASALIARFFLPFYSKADRSNDMGDIVSIRQVGGSFKKSYVNHPGVRVDDAEKEIYVRIDKERFLCEGFGGTPSSSSVASARPRQDRKVLRHQKEEYIAQVFEDASLMDMEKVMLKNLYSVRVVHNDLEQKAGHALMVKGRFALTFFHLMVYNFNYIIFTNVVSGNEYKFVKKDIIFQQLESGGRLIDACLLLLPRQFPLARDITSHFGSLASVQQTHFRGRLFSVRGLNGAVIRVSSGDVVAVDQPLEYYLSSNGERVALSVRLHYRYDIDTFGGDCGAVLMQADTRMRSKILGIHVAGSVGNVMDGNIGCAIYTEMLEQGFKALEKESSYFEAQLAPCFAGVLFDSTYVNDKFVGFDVLGRVQNGIAEVFKSNISRSPFHGDMGPATTRPAVLSSRDSEVDVKMRALSKITHVPVVEFDWQKLDLATDEAIRLICYQRVTAQDIQRRPLTIEESVFGIETDEHIDSINVTSSSGYPYVLDAKLPGKKSWIDLDAKTISSALVEDCVRRVDRAKAGKRTLTVFSDHLKDERRPLLDDKFMKPRLFSGGPLDFTIVFRQYFGAFMAFVMRNRIYNSVAVGMNVHDVEWTLFAERLLSRGDNILAGDFSNYDGTLNAEIVWRVLDVVNAWYKDGCNDIRRVLWAELASSVHLCRNVLYQCDHGNPSGNPMTTMLNSIYQYIAWVYVAQLCGMSVPQFVRSCCIVTYGDDNIMSVAKRALDPSALVEGFAKIGMKLTSEDKHRTFDYRSLSEVRFLKRAFRYESSVGRYLAPLPREVVVEMNYWFHKTNRWIEVRDDIAEASVREMAHFTEEDFDAFKRDVIAMYRSHSLMPPCFGTLVDYRACMLKDEYMYIEHT